MGGVGPPAPLPLPQSLVGDMEWEWHLAMLCNGQGCASSQYAVMYRTHCVQGVCFITKRCALLMFVPTTLVWFCHDFPQICFWEFTRAITTCSVLQMFPGACQLQDNRILPASNAVLCQQRRPPFPWHPGVNAKFKGTAVGPLLQTQLSCHRKKAESPPSKG